MLNGVLRQRSMSERSLLQTLLDTQFPVFHDIVDSISITREVAQWFTILNEAMH
jgi:hypothetical protein